ncbi:MAG: sigma-70 family RNA polymerase sigma factor [Nocardioidaceae bacterium]
MTDLLSDVDAPSDAELISRVRGGDVAAYGDLFSRHKDAAGRLARQLVRGPDSDDLVSEAFAKVLHVLQGGGGPDVAFRAYLLTAVRRLHVDRVRSGQRLQTTDDMTPFDPGVPFQDTAVAGFESGAAAKAFASLPERWQLVLWHLEVEGQKPADIAPLLGMSANSVSALAYRAREGLRQAFLTMHIADLTETDCRWVNEHLGAFIRKGLSKRDTGKVQSHLDECRRCTAMYLELTEVNSNLAGIIAPLLLGAAASGYLASSGAGAAGVLGLLSRVRDFVAANSGAVTAAGVAAGVATAAAVTAVALGGGSPDAKRVVADPPAPVSTPAAPAPSLPGTPGTKPRRSAGPTTTASTDPAAALTPLATPTITASAVPSVPAVPVVPDLSNDVPTDQATSTEPTTDPSTDPTAEAPVASSVDLSGTTIDDDGVHFVAVGTPTLPPTLVVRLRSDPGGVVFTQVGNDCDVAGDGHSAVCTTIAGVGARTPGTARMAADPSYSAELPFDPDLGPDNADVSISLAQLPDGFELSKVSGSVPSHRYARQVRVRQVDAALTLDPTAVRPTSGEEYAVTGTLALSGPAASRLAAVPYSVTGGTFLGGATTVTLPTDQAPSFVVVPADPSHPAVTVRVGVPSGYADTAPGNDESSPTLTPYDVGLTGLTAVGVTDATGHQTFTATLDRDGYPGALDYALDGAVADLTVETPSETGSTLTFVIASTLTDQGTTPVRLRAALPTGFTDGNAADNVTGDATYSYYITPISPVTDVDVAFLSLAPGSARPGPGDSYTLNGLVSVSGPAAADVSTIRYTITGGTFGPGAGCTATECTLTATGAPAFVVTPTDPATISTVRITAHAPAGLQDTDASNDAAEAILQRYDLSLSGLTAAPGRADAAGDQTFTATLATDAFPTPADLTYTATGGQVVSSSLVGSTVTFVVRSASGDAHDVTMTAALPSGYTDRVPADNTAGPTTWTPSDQVDLTLGGTPATVRPGPGETYAVSGTLAVTGPAAARVHDVTYTVTGAVFVEGGAATTTVTRHDDVTPSFVLTSPGTATATISAVAPGFTETGAGDNARTVLLDPYDVALGPLTATTGSADRSGDQTFTATVDKDGFTGPLAYSLTGPADLSLTLSVAGSTATFTVHSALEDRAPAGFTVRADLPKGYTDHATGDNSAVATYTYASTPFAFTTAKASGRQGGQWTVQATLTGVPQGASVVFGLTNPSEFVSATRCTISNAAHTLTCPSTSTRPFTVTFRAKLPGAQKQHGSLTAGVVGDPTRTATTTITD